MPAKIPLCLALTLGVCLSVLTTDATPSDATYSEDVLVPEEEFPQIDGTDLSHFTGLAQQTASTTLRVKICKERSICTFHVQAKGMASEQDRDHSSGNDFDQSKVEFDLVVSPGTAEKTFVLSATNFHEKDTDPSTGADNTVVDDTGSSTFQECLGQITRDVIQNSDGSLEMMAEPNPNNIDPGHKCAGFMKKIENILAGTLDQLAGVYADSVDVSLIQFSETVQDANGMRTTHYRREHHQDGSMTVHRSHAWELEESKHPQPVLIQGSEKSHSMAANGKTTVDANGCSTESHERTKNKLGGDSSKTGFSCTGSTTPDAEGRSCNTADVPADREQAQIVRLQQDTTIEITLVSVVAVTDLVQKPTLNEFLQEHTAAGRARISLLEAMRAEPIKRQPKDPVNAKQVFSSFVETLEEAKPSDFEPGRLRKELTRLMESPKIRRLTVAKLSKNEIHNHRAVQSLMHAIGRAGTEQVEAIDQLIELGGNPSVDEDARSQAIVALLQAKCYDHDYAIRRLAMLAKPNPQTFTQIMSLHVQHALIGHAEHCANNKYTDASANKYNDILSQSRKHLAEAAAAKKDAHVWILLDAIGNTHSQSSRETEAVASIANNDQLGAHTQRLAIKTLGRLYTVGALAALRKLSSSSDPEMQKAAEKAISGHHLHVSDPRKPPPSEVSTMALSQVDVSSKSGNLKFEKAWPMPATGDLRAEPKVGVELFETDKRDEPFCLHAYAGVDGKAWTYTVSLIQAGGVKCVGYKFYTYLEILGVTIWHKHWGSGHPYGSEIVEGRRRALPAKSPARPASPAHPNVAQFSQAGDQQGYCGMNVDAMELKGQIAYDKDFLDMSMKHPVGPFLVIGTIKLSGEVGLKAGWGKMSYANGSGDHRGETRCKSGDLVFAIPYAQATLRGELTLDMHAVRGGGGVEVTLVKFSLPGTSENMYDSDCAGAYFKAEAMGGKVYAFIDAWDPVKWNWDVHSWEVTIYEWSSPAAWTSNELKCEGQAKGTRCYTVKHKVNNRYLDAHETENQDFKAVTRPRQYNSSQKWKLIWAATGKQRTEQTLPYGNYEMMQMGTGRYLDAYESSQFHWRATTRPPQGNDSQEWTLTRTGSDYRIQHKVNGRYLDAYEHSKYDYQVTTAAWQGNDSQKWIISETPCS